MEDLSEMSARMDEFDLSIRRFGMSPDDLNFRINWPIRHARC
jgi:hypothetical protein